VGTTNARLTCGVLAQVFAAICKKCVSFSRQVQALVMFK